MDPRLALLVSGTTLLVGSLFLPVTVDPFGGQPAHYSFAFLFFYGLIIRTGEFSVLKLVLLTTGASSGALVVAPLFVWKPRARWRLIWFSVALLALATASSVALLKPVASLFSGYYVLLLALLVTAISCGLLWRRAQPSAV